MNDFQVHAECPTLAELHEFAAHRDEALRAHVNSCRRCQALAERMQREGAGALADVYAGSTAAVDESRRDAALARPLPARVDGALKGVGDVVIAASPDAADSLLVCVVIDPRPNSRPPTLEVAPISTEVRFASEFDVILPVGDPLGYPAIVEVWNHGTLSASQVIERLGALEGPVWAWVDALYRALHGDESAAVDGVPRGVPVISEDDPRAGFQEAEAERTGEFWKPAARLYSEREQDLSDAATVGDLLSRHLERTGWGIHAYAEHLGWREDELAALLSGSFDPRTVWPERVGKAARASGAGRDEFAAALDHSLTEDQFVGFGGGTSEAMVFTRAASARAKSGRSTRKAARDPDTERQRYIRRALRAFDQADGPKTIS